MYDRPLTAGGTKGRRGLPAGEVRDRWRGDDAVGRARGGCSRTRCRWAVDATPGAEIRYTLDGRSRRWTRRCNGPFLVSSTMTVKAKAFEGRLPAERHRDRGLHERGGCEPEELRELAAVVACGRGRAERAGDYWQDQSGQGNDGVQTSGRRCRGWCEAVERPAGDALRRRGHGRFSTAPAAMRTVFWVVRRRRRDGFGARSLGPPAAAGIPGWQRRARHDLEGTTRWRR